MKFRGWQLPLTLTFLFFKRVTIGLRANSHRFTEFSLINLGKIHMENPMVSACFRSIFPSFNQWRGGVFNFASVKGASAVLITNVASEWGVWAPGTTRNRTSELPFLGSSSGCYGDCYKTLVPVKESSKLLIWCALCEKNDFGWGTN